MYKKVVWAILSTAEAVRLKNRAVLYKKNQRNYANNPIREDVSPAVEGSFYSARPMTVREMVIRRINNSLCFCLMVTIAVTFVSYYIAMNYEAKLNALDNEIVRINSENQDIQADLDKYKSFNNVDNKIGKFNILKKANQVIEVTALSEAESMNTESAPSPVKKENISWAIGY